MYERGNEWQDTGTVSKQARQLDIKIYKRKPCKNLESREADIVAQMINKPCKPVEGSSIWAKKIVWFGA